MKQISIDDPIMIDEEKIVSIVEEVSRSVVGIGTFRILRDMLLHPYPVKGIGSGIIVSPDGYIATNSHVIAGSRRVEVTFPEGLTVEAEVVGSDPMFDVAVLKTNVTSLKPVRLGDSGKLRVGQLVLAIGKSLGLPGEPTVTLGVISALHRSISSEKLFLQDLIQTDAAINPGNSGGPLVNLEGETVGMNTAVIPYAQGIGFAIPSDKVRRAVEEIIAYGRVRRGWLGIVGLTVNTRLARYYGLAVDRGVLVVRVDSRSPAYKAGVKPGDVIVSLEGEPVKNTESLLNLLYKFKVGNTIALEAFRGSRRVTFRIMLVSPPSIEI